MYHILVGKSLEKLENIVQLHIENDYIPIGNVTIEKRGFHNSYIQVVIHRSIFDQKMNAIGDNCDGWKGEEENVKSSMDILS